MEILEMPPPPLSKISRLTCHLYISDASDEAARVDFGGVLHFKKKIYVTEVSSIYTLSLSMIHILHFLLCHMSYT